MPLPPAIDPRGYDDLVVSIESLARAYTETDLSPATGALAGAILAAPITLSTTGSVLPAGTVLSVDQAEQIRQAPDLASVAVAGWLPPGSSLFVAATTEALLGRILDEDIVDTVGSTATASGGGSPRRVPDPSRTRIITQGTLLDAALAERVARIRANEVVRIRLGPDAGGALVRIFARMAAQVIERINRTPEKNLLAFLDLIGAEMLPPQPARAPVTFRLAAVPAGDWIGPTIPARTVVIAPRADRPDGISFETERELATTPAGLAAVFVRQPDADAYDDRTAAAAGLEDAVFPAFAAATGVEHALFVAHDAFYGLPEPKRVTLLISSPDAAQLAQLPLAWQTWTEDGPAALTATTGAISRTQCEITFPNLPPVVPTVVDGHSALWLKATLGVRIPPGRLTPAGATALAAQHELTPAALVLGRRAVDPAASFAPFGESEPPNRFVYLNLQVPDEWLPGGVRIPGARVALDLELDAPGVASANLVMVARYLVGSTWHELGRSTRAAGSSGVATFGYDDTSLALTRNGTISFAMPPDWTATTFFGEGGQYVNFGRWLRLDIETGDYGTGSTFRPPRVRRLVVSLRWPIPAIDRITTTVTIARDAAAPLMPDFVFANDTRLDPSKFLNPFGERPRLNDVFYLGSGEAFANPTATASLYVTLVNPDETQAKPADWSKPPVPVLASPNLEIAWEIWTGERWHEVGRSAPPNRPAADPAVPAGQVSDSTRALTRDGTVSVTLPSALGRSSVAGATSFWLRARIAAGNYGVDAYYRETTNPAGYQLVPPTFRPPVIKSVRLGYSFTRGEPPTACKTLNDWAFADCTAETSSQGGGLARPFLPAQERRPALYLGFDRPFGNRPATLYIEVEPAPFDLAGGSARRATSDLPALAWEYAGPTGWTPIAVEDETNALVERGMVTLVGPRDMVEQADFGRRLRWLRARWVGGSYQAPPRLRRIATNTVWARQAATFQDEVIGSSDGSPDQTFRTARAPVLLGEWIEVYEPKLPPAAEVAALIEVGGPAAVRPVQDEAGRDQGAWVRWQPVADFYSSGSRDRHYTLDRVNGLVRFGDGRHGMLPPQGRNNIRAATYRSGGGAAGNVPAGAIGELNTTLPYVDGVTNVAPAGGGAEAETLLEVMERGPRMLRHGGRAVTAQDFEDLAQAASPDVGRARAIMPAFNPVDLPWYDPETGPPAGTQPIAGAGEVTLLVVPHRGGKPPTLSLDLVAQVDDYLRPRCDPTVTLHVAAPYWIAVQVTAEVTPALLDVADTLASTVVAVLDRFLDPLIGAGGAGWAFGRLPHASDILAQLEAVAGLDHVISLVIDAQYVDEERDLEQATPADLLRSLIFSGPHSITVVTPSGEH